MSPPPEPHDWTQWPSIEEVIYALQADERRYHLVIMDDVLIAVPNKAKDCLTRFCRRVNTNLWEEYVDRQAALSLSGSRLVTAGFRLMGKSILRKVRRALLPKLKPSKNLGRDGADVLLPRTGTVKLRLGILSETQSLNVPLSCRSLIS